MVIAESSVKLSDEAWSWLQDFAGAEIADVCGRRTIVVSVPDAYCPTCEREVEAYAGIMITAVNAADIEWIENDELFCSYCGPSGQAFQSEEAYDLAVRELAEDIIFESTRDRDLET